MSPSNQIFFHCVQRRVKSWNHVTESEWFGVGRDLKDNLVSTPVSWARTSSTRRGCSGAHAASLSKK